jgi:hypothetical protein
MSKGKKKEVQAVQPGSKSKGSGWRSKFRRKK